MKLIEEYKIGKATYSFTKEKAKLGPGHIFGVKIVTILSTGEEVVREGVFPTQQAAHKFAFPTKKAAA